MKCILIDQNRVHYTPGSENYWYWFLPAAGAEPVCSVAAELQTDLQRAPLLWDRPGYCWTAAGRGLFQLPGNLKKK